MIETQVPLKFPPGLLTNGTMMDREGRWAGGNLVRFPDGYPQAMGSWSALSLSGTPPTPGTPSGAYAWFTHHDTSLRVAVGQGGKVYTIRRNSAAPHSMTNISPAGAPATDNTLLGWSFANLDDVLLACRCGAAANGVLYSWTPSAGGLATQVSGSPSLVRGVFVTAENFVMVLENERDITWPSQGTLTTWTPSASNSAGGLSIPSASHLLVGKKVRGQNLVWTEDDVWSLNYVGAPLYYGASFVSAGQGAIGPNVIAVAGETAYWMGFGGFYKYDGFVQELECEVADSVFTSAMAKQYGARFFAIVNTQFSEIQWFYCSSVLSTTPDKMVAYNYANNTWSLGSLARAAGCDAVWHDTAGVENTSPLLFDANGTTVYQHEIEVLGSPVAAGAYIESGPSQIDDGNHVARIQKLIADGAAVNDDITLFSGGFPNFGSETTNGPYEVLHAGPIDVRFSARYVRYKQTLEKLTSRVGVPRLGVIQEGTR